MSQRVRAERDEDIRAECERLKQENIALKAELEPFRYLKSKKRLLKVDYGYNPKSRDWKATPFIQRLTERLKSEEADYIARLKSYMSFVPQLKQIALTEKDCASPTEPFWLNDWIPGLDAISLYCTVAMKKPRFYVEIGSGNSTKFVRRAISDFNLSTKIVSIDPSPRVEIDAICDEIIRKPCEDMDLSFFNILTADDMLFVDNSHISFMNTDVTVFFCEILGMLPRGMMYGLHDIHLPLDYPQIWTDRWYNEQYLLLAYLAGGGQGDKIILPNYYMYSFHDIPKLLANFYGTSPFDRVQTVGGIFWMERA